MIFRRVATEPEAPRRKVSTSFLVSLAVHVVVVIAFMQMLILNADFSPNPKRDASREQRVGFVRLARPGEKPTPGKSGGDGRIEAPRAIRVTAPTFVPNTIPAPSPTVTKATDEGGSGPLIGGGGPVRGVRPNYSDGRLWNPPQQVVVPPKTVAQTIDSIIVDAIAPYNDSVAAVAAGRDPTDWTIKKGGYKWGMDKRAIRLGPVSIPTALLALLPLNITGNPSTMERERSYAAMNRDINWHAQQAINDADFMKAVRSIRERKERERAAALTSTPTKDVTPASKDGTGDQPH
jgi:hypothetical protein